jgi:hypothetical protein
MSGFLFALVALGWLVALKAHDQQAKDEQYQQLSTNDSGGEDAWLSSLTH